MRPVGAYHRACILLIASVALSNSVHYFPVVTYPLAKRRLEIHASMINATAPSQYRHRVLIPYIAHLCTRTIQLVAAGQTDSPDRPGSQKALLFAYLSLDTMGIFFGLLGTYLLARTWMEQHWALLASMLCGALLPLTFSDVLFHPWSQAEFAFFAIGLLLAVKQRFAWLALLVFAASVNRETSLFLVIGATAVMWGHSQAKIWAAAYLAIWLAVFWGLRFTLGFPAPTFTMRMAIEGNLSAERLGWTLLLNTVVFGPIWWFIWRGYSIAPEVIKRAAWSIPPHCGLLLVIGYWNEIRYWTAVFPILVPLATTQVAELAKLHETRMGEVNTRHEPARAKAHHAGAINGG